MTHFTKIQVTNLQALVSRRTVKERLSLINSNLWFREIGHVHGSEVHLCTISICDVIFLPEPSIQTNSASMKSS